MCGDKTGDKNGKILWLLKSGKSLKEIIEEGDYDLKAYIFMNYKDVTRMIGNWAKWDISHNLPKYQ